MACLSVEGRVLMNEIRALMKGSREIPWPFPPCEDTLRRTLTKTIALISGFQLQNYKKETSVVCKLPSLWYFVLAIHFATLFLE